MAKIAYKARIGRRSRYTAKGRRKLAGKSIDVRARKLRLQVEDAPPEPIIVQGPNGAKLLNSQETIVQLALERRLGASEFSTQVQIGDPGRLGSGSVDWIIWKIRVALEFQGPQHLTETGRAKDSLRVLARKQEGLSTVYLYAHHLPNIDKVLNDILAFPGVWIATSSRGFY